MIVDRPQLSPKRIAGSPRCADLLAVSAIKFRPVKAEEENGQEREGRSSVAVVRNHLWRQHAFGDG